VSLFDPVTVNWSTLFCSVVSLFLVVSAARKMWADRSFVDNMLVDVKDLVDLLRNSYTDEQILAAVEKIKADMKQRGEWDGED
jgi:hypothetical protein